MWYTLKYFHPTCLSKMYLYTRPFNLFITYIFIICLPTNCIHENYEVNLGNAYRSICPLNTLNFLNNIKNDLNVANVTHHKPHWIWNNLY
jgi:hypothetical protein